MYREKYNEGGVGRHLSSEQYNCERTHRKAKILPAPAYYGTLSAAQLSCAAIFFFFFSPTPVCTLKLRVFCAWKKVREIFLFENSCWSEILDLIAVYS